MKKLNKKNLLVSAASVATAATLLFSGATFAYLQDETEDVVNTMNTNKVFVDLYETDDEGNQVKSRDYDIVPGTTATKDPTVSVDNTVTAYVFVEITDTSNGVIKYELEDDWLPLEGTDNVYYREVPAKANPTDPDQVFHVLKEDQIAFDKSIQNSDMVKSDGKTLKAPYTLTFKASAIQKEGFADAASAWLQVPEEVATATEFGAAINAGKPVTLTKNLNLAKSRLTITKDATIDLNGHTLSGTTISNKDALVVDGANVTVKNGTISAPATRSSGASALLVQGESNVVIDNCTLKTNSNQSFAVCTNGSTSLNSTVEITNSTIVAPTVAGKKGFALYAPAGNVTFKNCNVTGHIFISGGNVTLDGGTYTATGFNNQAKIWNKADTADYVGKSAGGTAINMGDSILIADRRDGYTLSGLTIKNITFNTNITLADGTEATAYAIKYVDMNANGAESRVPYVIENNTFNNQIDGADPVMFIDLTGADIANP